MSSQPGTSKSPLPAAASWTAAETSVRQLIENGKEITAPDRAKDLHKTRQDAASESLLLDAYAARIRALSRQNLHLEAESLLDLVRQRYPAAAARLSEAADSTAARAGKIDELLCVLADPGVAPERRASVGTSARRKRVRSVCYRGLQRRSAGSSGPAGRLGNTAGSCSSLQRTGHGRSDCAPRSVPPQPVGAVETAGPRHRLFLSWGRRGMPAIPGCHQAGIGGVAAGRRRDTDDARGAKPARLTPAASALVSSIISHPAALRRALEELDRALDSHENGRILKCVRDAIGACRVHAPDQIERPGNIVLVRGALEDLDSTKVVAAMGGQPRNDAYFLRLFARGMENSASPSMSRRPAQRGMNSAGRRCARDGSPPTARKPPPLPAHRRCCENCRTSCCGSCNAPAKREKSSEELYFLYPEKLYERACALDPHFESFAQWMEWAKRSSKEQAERVARRGARSARWISSLFCT